MTIPQGETVDSETLSTLVNDEERAWDYIGKLRELDLHNALGNVKPMTHTDALIRAVETTQSILSDLASSGINLSDADPGHALGHMGRDYIHAIQLMMRMELHQRDLFIGFLGGVLHDIGCAIVDRYKEANRVIRHAEAGAVVLEALFDENSYGLNRSEQLLIQYAVMAHTQYLKTFEVTSSTDGVARTIAPYTDTFAHDAPVLAIWLPRWIDRLDCNGPTFVGRHYLTQIESHKDFDSTTGKFYAVKFSEHMQPLLRSNEEIAADGSGRTMREHFAMFADSQNANSPYGLWDDLSPTMVRLRNQQTKRLRRIISDIVPSDEFRQDTENILYAWGEFLALNVEPTTTGIRAASELATAFTELDTQTQVAWTNGFRTTMKEYLDWSQEILSSLELLNPKLLYFPPLQSDIREMLIPAHSLQTL